ncbi:hypothetical protein PATSB16_21870 [Pandoraea thiooxydans]|nr:hypothetical protein PATSB16_21870 [Pandoraea thiooxydans]
MNHYRTKWRQPLPTIFELGRRAVRRFGARSRGLSTRMCGCYNLGLSRVLS